MQNGKTVACIIPARLQSSRFPKKILAKLSGHSLMEWTYSSAIACKYFDYVAFAIDSIEAQEICESINAPYLMTPKDIPNGTTRLIYYRDQADIQADIWIGWQVDEPFVSPTMIQQLLSNSASNEWDVFTLKKQIFERVDIQDPNIVKVVTDKHGSALYFSRAPIPYTKNLKETSYFKHIGIYGFTDRVLNKIKNLSSSKLETAENLEQLAFLEEGIKIFVAETPFSAIGIDTPNDLKLAQDYIDSNADVICFT